MQDKDKLYIFDVIRGLAGFYVMLGHARWLLWEGYSSGYLVNHASYSILDKLLMYFFMGARYGHQAVVVFFVLSGFVIHLRYSKLLQSNEGAVRFDYLDFFKRRIKRIFPPLVFALVITFIFDSLGHHIYSAIYEGQSIYPAINGNVGNDLSFTTFLGNISFLMRFYIPVYGSNGPLWSLSYEWWFYVLYPLFFILTRKSFLFSLLMPILLLLLGVIGFIPSLLVTEVFKYFAVWFLGVLLADVYTKRIKITYLQYALLFIIGVFSLVFSRGGFESDLSMGLVIAGIFSFLLYLTSKGIVLKPCKVLTFMANVSYSLYVCHMPVLVFFSACIMLAMGGVLPIHSYFIFIGIFCSLGVAFASYCIAEKPFKKN